MRLMAKELLLSGNLTDSGNFCLIPYTNGTVHTVSNVAIQKQSNSIRICGNYKELY